MSDFDLIIIGGGLAGLAAAIAAREEGINNILILEREEQLGGSLNQFIDIVYNDCNEKEALTGPELAQIYVDRIKEFNIVFKLNALAIELTEGRLVTAVTEAGVMEFRAKAVILAMGSREKPRGAINVPGNKSAGIFTAGAAQRFVNLEGYMPGKQVLIIGSGDMGLIMARRMTLEGASVKAVVELMLHPAGTKENVKQCLEDFNISLKLGYTVVEIKGKDRVEGAVIAKVDEKNIPIMSTEEYIVCDTILLSANFLPENELSAKAGVALSSITSGAIVDESMCTSIKGIFACGDVIYIHNYKASVVDESCKAGRSAAKYIKKEKAEQQ
jgi:sarcosine oxidase subunit alpha